MHQEYRILLQDTVIHAGVGDVQVEDRGRGIENRYEKNARFRYGVHAGIEKREIKPEKYRGNRGRDQQTAQYRAEHDGCNGQAFYPAIRDDQFFRRQQFGEDTVFCW